MTRTPCPHNVGNGNHSGQRACFQGNSHFFDFGSVELNKTGGRDSWPGTVPIHSPWQWTTVLCRTSLGPKRAAAELAANQVPNSHLGVARKRFLFTACQSQSRPTSAGRKFSPRGKEQAGPGADSGAAPRCVRGLPWPLDPSFAGLDRCLRKLGGDPQLGIDHAQARIGNSGAVLAGLPHRRFSPPRKR